MATVESLTMICAEPEDLVPLATGLAAILASGDILLLTGPLGAGKTTLVQLLTQALGVGADQYVSSPSFALLHEYSGRLPVFHMDLYRLRDEEDVEAAGLIEYFDHQGVCMIEWPDRLGALAPDDALEIRIEPNPLGVRTCTVTGHGTSWRQRMGRIAASLARKAT